MSKRFDMFDETDNSAPVDKKSITKMKLTRDLGTVSAVPKPIVMTKEERRIHRLEVKLMKAKQTVQKAKQPKLSELKKKVQKEVNAYVRNRDRDLPCISCGKSEGPWQAGHYIAQGSSGALRFDLDNIHKQCVTCNLYKHGNLLEYRLGLAKLWNDTDKYLKIEWLEAHRHDSKKWTREELEEIRNLLKQ
jgi:hypothetical protein